MDKTVNPKTNTTIEWITADIGVVRFGKDHHEFGDPFELSCVIKREDDHWFIRGLAGRNMKREYHDQLMELLRPFGIKLVRFIRAGKKCEIKI